MNLPSWVIPVILIVIVFLFLVAQVDFSGMSFGETVFQVRILIGVAVAIVGAVIGSVALSGSGQGMIIGAVMGLVTGQLLYAFALILWDNLVKAS
jgi:hypothetical protein